MESMESKKIVTPPVHLKEAVENCNLKYMR